MTDIKYTDPTSNTEEEQKTEETMLILVPTMDSDYCALEYKSPHHQCTYSDCQVTCRIVLIRPLKNLIQRHANISFITFATLIIHQIHMYRVKIFYP